MSVSRIFGKTDLYLTICEADGNRNFRDQLTYFDILAEKMPKCGTKE